MDGWMDGWMDEGRREGNSEDEPRWPTRARRDKAGHTDRNDVYSGGGGSCKAELCVSAVRAPGEGRGEERRGERCESAAAAVEAIGLECLLRSTPSLCVWPCTGVRICERTARSVGTPSIAVGFGAKRDPMARSQRP